MKTQFILLAVCVAGSLTLGLSSASATMEVSAGVSIHATTEFYEPLAPHGAWVTVGSYGRCWRPAGVVAGWRPYCNGYWEWTDCGWYWVNDEPWAWACYHYGTWVYDADYGWVWVPDIEWAPAWVTWRVSAGYIGWAPRPPHRWLFARHAEPSAFVFVETSHFHDQQQPSTVIVNNTTVIKQTTEINNVRREDRKFDGRSQKVVINEGPRLDVVEKAAGRQFTPVSIREADRRTPRTTISIPEKISRPAPESAQPKPSPLQQQTKPALEHKPAPEGNPKIIQERPVPQPLIPREKVIPPPNRELPLPRPPQQMIPPQQPLLPKPAPILPRGNPPQKGQGKDKDRDGH